MRLARNLPFILALLLTSAATPTAASEDAVTIAREWRKSHEQAIVQDFVTLLSIPNVASDTPNIRRNAEHILSLLPSRGFEARLLEADGGPPAVFAERTTPGAETTLLIYAHYDGQPVNAADWASDPWTPVLRDGPVELGGEPVPLEAPFDPEARLFARSAGDDKAPVIALLTALDALDAAGTPLSVNLKILFDGEEEAGSPHLPAILERHRDLVAADLWLFCDGPMHQSRRPQINYGVRGAWGFGLTVYGANRPLHSGHYGNWAPNPIMRLIELISSMRDGEGNILVAGYGDEVVQPSLSELEAVNAAPPVDEGLVRELGIGAPETDDRVELAIMRPAMNLRGIRSGDVGEAARNSIQTEATASIGLRLVPNQTPQYLREVIERHIRGQGYHIVYTPPTAAERAEHDRIALLDWTEAGYPAYRAPMDLPIAQRVAAIVDAVADGQLVHLPTMGGSLPLKLVYEAVETPILILPIANHDNNQHGANENLRLQNLWDAIEVYAAVITEL
ncbi:M20/M25/M40 family metallo-hydrolase [Elongatibacter sediminis]|uniref:M20/M25/M40 family metallo-hydrolase n=1 Tax=Elongatibacter sediminis TaxID=3119006 RepID=A0AAW9RG09_9GAMM